MLALLSMTAQPPDRSDVAVLERDVRVGFTFDAAGRMVAINEPGAPRAPRFVLEWTPRAAIWRVRDDVPPAVVARLEAVVAATRSGLPIDGPPACLAEIRAALTA